MKDYILSLHASDTCTINTIYFDLKTNSDNFKYRYTKQFIMKCQNICCLKSILHKKRNNVILNTFLLLLIFMITNGVLDVSNYVLIKFCQQPLEPNTTSNLSVCTSSTQNRKYIRCPFRFQDLF